MLPLFKTLASLALQNGAVARFVRRRQRVNLIALCFHRFGTAENEGSGHDLRMLDETLSWLRRAGFVFADLEGVVLGLVQGRSPDRPTVVVTIDDGYADMVNAIPVFARHGCPVSVFLATGFLDARTPLWWDQIQLLLASASGHAQLDDVAGITWSARWQSSAERLRAGDRLVELVKRKREPARQAVIDALAHQVAAHAPAGEVRGFEPLHWDDVRALEREGVRFGPHTHTHPILSALDDSTARFEVTHSWLRLREEVTQPLPIFAYPNGTPWSFGERDIASIRDAGLIAAVTTDAQWCLAPGAPVDPYVIGRVISPMELPALQASVFRLRAPV